MKDKSIWWDGYIIKDSVNHKVDFLATQNFSHIERPWGASCIHQPPRQPMLINLTHSLNYLAWPLQSRPQVLSIPPCCQCTTPDLHGHTWPAQGARIPNGGVFRLQHFQGPDCKLLGADIFFAQWVMMGAWPWASQGVRDLYMGDGYFLWWKFHYFSFLQSNPHENSPPL